MKSKLTYNPKPMTSVPCQVFENGTYVMVDKREYLGSIGIVSTVSDNNQPRKAIIYLSNGSYDWAEDVRGLALPMDSTLTIQTNQYK